MYFNHWYKTVEDDFSDENQSTFWVQIQLKKPTDSQYLPYWNKFFEISGEEREITHFRISMSNGRYNATNPVLYWTGTQYLNYQSGPKPTPDNIVLIVAFIKYIHGGETPIAIPRTLDLYIRTLGRIALHVRLCPGYSFNG